MAAKKPARKAAKVKAPKRRLFNPGWILLPPLIGAVAIFYPDASIVFTIGMLPTLVTVTVSQGPGSGARMLTLGLMNLTGVVQVIAELPGPKYAGLGASGPMSDVYAWLMMYGAAALGGALNWAAPVVAAAVLTYVDRFDVRRMQSARRNLIEEWGEGLDENAGV